MENLDISFAESDVKILLESLIEKESRMAAICDTSEDEDEVADIGNDLIELRLLIKTVKARAVSQFGPAILEFSRTPL